MERLTIPDEPIEGGTRRAIIDARAVRGEAMTIYWRLKKYEDICPDPERLKGVDRLYLEKCQEVSALTKRMRWIPVAERLPDSGNEVLTYKAQLCGGWMEGIPGIRVHRPLGRHGESV